MLKPEGFLSVGMLAAAMGTTARTLRHYDSIGLLTPGAVSSGGHRLYSFADLVRLAEIQYLQGMGFGLEIIRDRLLSPASREAFETELKDKAQALRTQIEALAHSLREVEALQREVKEAGAIYLAIDVARSVTIVEALTASVTAITDLTGVPGAVIENLTAKGDQWCAELGARWREAWKAADDAILAGQAPNSTRGLKLGEKYWQLLTELVGGNLSLLPEMDKQEVTTSKDDPLQDDTKAHLMALEAWLMLACDTYLNSIGFEF